MHDLMRDGPELRVAPQGAGLREATELRDATGRTVILVDENGAFATRAAIPRFIARCCGGRATPERAAQFFLSRAARRPNGESATSSVVSAGGSKAASGLRG